MSVVMSTIQQMPELVPFIDKSGELTNWAWVLIFWLIFKR